MNSEQSSTNPTVPIIEQVAQPENNLTHSDESLSHPVKHDAPGEDLVIWTPRFIMFFAVTLVLGVSLESLLTQGWAIRWYTGTWVFLAHIALVSAGWIALLVVSRSLWIRAGAAFGLLGMAFITVNIVIQILLGQPSGYLLAHVNALTCLTLFGCSICLTINFQPTSRWDAWLLGLMPLIGLVLLAPLYILRADRSIAGLENSVTIVSLVLSILIWWIRPTCWRNAPGPTFLFGFVPLLLLMLDIVYVGNGSFNFFPVHVTLKAMATLSSRETVFFFSQALLLCLLLGTLRLLKSEKLAKP